MPSELENRVETRSLLTAVLRYNWVASRKWTVVAASCWTTLIVGLNSTAITTATDAVASDFHISNGTFEYVYLTVTAWNAAAAIVPLFTLPLMEAYGMRVGYLVRRCARLLPAISLTTQLCYAMFTIFVIPQALAPNLATLIVSRVIAGAFGGTIQNAVDGVIANLFRSSAERALPLTLYIFSLLAGVTLGPVWGSLGTGSLSWRWIFWIQLILYASAGPFLALLIPETRNSIVRARLLSSRRPEPQKGRLPSDLSKTARDIAQISAKAVIMLFTSPVLASFTLLSSFAFGLVFSATDSIPLVFSTVYGFNPSETGVVQVALAIGELLGLVIALIQNRFYSRSAASDQGTDPMAAAGLSIPVAEAILPASVISIPVFLAGGLFVYGFTALFSAPWVAPAIGLAMQGVSIQVVVAAVSIYITDFYPLNAASAIAAVAAGENIMAAFLPLGIKPMYLRLGFGWASGLLGFLALALTTAPLVLAWKGKSIREKSSD